MCPSLTDRRLEPGEMLGKYEVLAHVGEGAAADVYLVRSTDFADEPVALAAKVLKPSMVNLHYVRSKFAEETSILAGIDHPHVIRVVDAVQADDLHAFIMQHVDGSTLEEYLPLHPGGLSEVITATIALQIVDAMICAHRHRIVHRDLKPANILIGQDEQGQLHAYVADFGLAKVLNKQSKTRTGLQIGTMAYMAPEQIQDSSRVDARADIYAIGVTLFECLTGSLPYPYRSVYEMLEAQLSQPMPLVRHHRSDVSERWDELIAKACAKKRDARFGSADELLAGLLRIGRELGVGDRSTMAVAPIRKVDPSLASGVDTSEFAARPRNTQESASVGVSFSTDEERAEFARDAGRALLDTALGDEQPAVGTATGAAGDRAQGAPVDHVSEPNEGLASQVEFAPYAPTAPMMAIPSGPLAEVERAIATRLHTAEGPAAEPPGDTPVVRVEPAAMAAAAALATAANMAAVGAPKSAHVLVALIVILALAALGLGLYFSAQ